MNQIITQHGWGLDHRTWSRLKNKFIQNNWLWQDNNRGYFSETSISSKWIKDNSINSTKVALCHSLGVHLMDRNVLKEATHVVLINSFNNFIPNNSQEKYTLRALKRMEKKINLLEINSLLEEFIKKSFMPNKVDIDFQSIYKTDNKVININILLKDFKKLYIKNHIKRFFSEKTEILIIKARNDLILNEFSCYEFAKILNDSQISKPKLLELNRQGHLTTNIDIAKIIENWIKILNYE